ncbi:MAG: hypothetical protein GTO63_14735 [Anaerolineae bacterium]|nr:hypothetical protein [Anaerolineae bacterium]NIN96100.1 hypothetical protein [Anaerolineae bacterium]NIQ79133.1 hypothetical protein [Anaerolineae bacterium]
MSTRVLQLLAVAGIVALLISGCATQGPPQTESQTVALGEAESVRVEIMMGGGALLVRGGAEDLLEADFTYRHQSWRPQVEYSVAGSEGSLTIRQPSTLVVVPGGGVPAEWDLRLNSDVPMNMDITFGGGGGALDLGNLNLRRVDIKFGGGGAKIDLTGEWERDVDVSIIGGAGGVSLTLPRDVGVRVDVTRGLGSVDASGLRKEGDAYVNDVYGESDVTLQVDVVVGVGGVDLELGD